MDSSPAKRIEISLFDCDERDGLQSYRQIDGQLVPPILVATILFASLVQRETSHHVNLTANASNSHRSLFKQHVCTLADFCLGDVDLINSLDLL